MSRRVYYRPEFNRDAMLLGGIAAVQRVIAPIIQTLEEGDPTGFGLLDVGTSIRYASTRSVGNMPPLVVTFRIDEDDDVAMLSVTARMSR